MALHVKPALRRLFRRPGFAAVAVLTLALGLLAVALLASYLPARRAARVDPAVSLRSE